METLYIILIVFSFISIITAISCFIEMWGDNSELKLWWLPNQLVNSWCQKQQINKVGHFIADIFINILLLPMMIVLLILNGIVWGLIYSICIFAWIFRKR